MKTTFKVLLVDDKTPVEFTVNVEASGLNTNVTGYFTDQSIYDQRWGSATSMHIENINKVVDIFIDKAHFTFSNLNQANFLPDINETI